ncbi:uncharacterized protein [Amphiura filiformis]|uniref:uncharacterized protein n=1 Tax=Amphiura filiformis TaxID=82378 RepID=UPI003B214F10
MTTSNPIVVQIPPQQSGGQVQQIIIPPQPPGGQQQQIVLPIQQVGGQQQAQRKTFNWRGLRVLGILHLLIAAVEITATSFALAFGTDYRVAVGIWAGICFYGVTGVLGISAKRNNQGVIISYLVFCLVNILVGMVNLVFDAIGADHNGDRECEDESYPEHYTNYFYGNCDKLNSRGIAHTIGAVVAAVQVIVTIVGSCFGCCGVCACCANCCACCGITPVTNTQVTNQPQTIVIQYQPNQQGSTPQGVQQQTPNEFYAPPTHYQGPPPAYEESHLAGASAPPPENSGYEHPYMGLNVK